MGIFSSKGIKRYTSTVLGTALVFVSGIPVLGPIVSVLFGINGVLGAVGLAQGALAKTIIAHGPATIGAVLAVLYAVAEHIPACEPYLPVLKLLMTTVGGYTVAKGTKSSLVATK